MSQPLLQVDGLRTYFRTRGEPLRAVDGVSFTIQRGETLGLVGESGCGKSTLAKTIVGLEKPNKGQIDFLGIDITRIVEKRDKETIRKILMVFQDPEGTLNPSYTIGDQIAAAVQRLTNLPKKQVREEVIRLLKAVRLDANYYGRYPRRDITGADRYGWLGKY